MPTSSSDTGRDARTDAHRAPWPAGAPRRAAAAPSSSVDVSRALARALARPLALSSRPLHRFDRGALLLRAGAPVRRLPYVVAGRVDAVLHDARGEASPVVPIVFGAGEFVLLSQLFCEQPSGIDLVAGRALQLRWVPVAEIEGVLAHDGAALLLLVRFLAQRLQEVQSRERAWVGRSVHDRVCAALARMAAEGSADAAGRRSLATTHEQLAARCGVSRPKVSIALKRLEQAGRVRLARGSIEILDLRALQAADR